MLIFATLLKRRLDKHYEDKLRDYQHGFWNAGHQRIMHLY